MNYIKKKLESLPETICRQVEVIYRDEKLNDHAMVCRFCRDCDLSPMNIRHWKNGKVPSGRSIVKLAVGSGYSLEFLLGLSHSRYKFDCTLLENMRDIKWKSAEHINILCDENFKKDYCHDYMAMDIGVLPQPFGCYLRGERIPNAKDLVMLSLFFNVSPDYIAGLSNKRDLEE